jgi:hypothetical protein
MRHSRRSPNVVTELARRIHGVAGQAASKERVERWQVIGTSPLLIEEVEGDLVLEDGDPDFTIGVALRQHVATYGIGIGDLVLVSVSGEEWHAFDAVTAIEPSKRAAG